ncbi:MAG: AAC(3) family N-acetyltransferase [Oscillospiraceae bacterium]|nr:AAC(3) family N-acetyltransferase [Oscillospiraceae bacterium]
MTESERYRQQMKELGLCSGDVVLVHSSMKAMQTKRTPEEIIGDIEAVIGEEGTLLMPALTYENVNAENPVFDSDTTEPCIGLLSEVFWRMPGVVRSVNPTHSVCAKGRLAHTLTVGHIMDDTAVGVHSPFMLLPVYKGKLLFIGEILDSCTFMHGVEEIVKPPYIRPTEPKTYTVNGEKRAYRGGDDFGWGSEFGRIEWILEEPDIRKGQIGEAKAFLIDSRALLAAALLKMRADPYAFVTDISMWI